MVTDFQEGVEQKRAHDQKQVQFSQDQVHQGQQDQGSTVRERRPPQRAPDEAAEQIKAVVQPRLRVVGIRVGFLAIVEFGAEDGAPVQGGIQAIVIVVFQQQQLREYADRGLAARSSFGFFSKGGVG